MSEKKLTDSIPTIPAMFDYFSIEGCQHKECRFHVRPLEGDRVLLETPNTNSTDHFVGDEILDKWEIFQKTPEEIASQKLFLLHGGSLENILIERPATIHDLGLAYEEFRGKSWLVAIPRVPAPSAVWLAIAQEMVRKRRAVLLVENPEEGKYILRFLNQTESDLIENLASWIQNNFLGWILEDEDFRKFSAGPFLVKQDGTIATSEEAKKVVDDLLDAANLIFKSELELLLKEGIEGFEPDRWSKRMLNDEILKSFNPSVM